MSKEKKLILGNRPSGIKTLYNAFKTKKHKTGIGRRISDIEAEWQNVRLCRKHIRKFNQICGLDNGDSVHMLYPFTLTYPLNLWLISQPDVPVPMFRMLTTRNTTIIHREINNKATLVVSTKINGRNFIKNGMEFYIDSEITDKDELVWENRSALFVPGSTDKEGIDSPSFKLKDIPDADIQNNWFFPAKDRFRFARIMGDSNGIHYSKYYAKMFGYKRDFAQPIRVVAKSIDSLPKLTGNRPLKLDMFFKGPVYYNSELILKNLKNDKSNRFDLYCEGNERPCICGKLEKI